MFVKPMRRIVLDPVTKRVLPQEGGEVPESAYWQRRLRDGDVELAVPPPPVAPAPPKRSAADTPTQ